MEIKKFIKAVIKDVKDHRAEINKIDNMIMNHSTTSSTFKSALKADRHLIRATRKYRKFIMNDGVKYDEASRLARLAAWIEVDPEAFAKHKEELIRIIQKAEETPKTP